MTREERRKLTEHRKNRTKALKAMLREITNNKRRKRV